MTCFTCMGEHDPDDACAPVKRKKEREHDDNEFGEAFEARFSGRCSGSGDRIYPGEQVCSGPGGYWHFGCVDES